MTTVTQIIPPNGRHADTRTRSPLLTGLTASGRFKEQERCADVLDRAIELLIASTNVFVYGNSIVLLLSHKDLIPLCSGSKVEVFAADILLNVFACADDEQEFPPPKSFVNRLLHWQATWERLPRIRVFARRPVFDSDFRLQGPGWHADSGILVHGPAIQPRLYEPSASAQTTVERLPHHLRQLLVGFRFRSDSDLVGALALLLTGVFVHAFIEEGKPVGLLDGNQPGIGKTLVARVVGWVLDGHEPPLIAYKSNELELEKQICSSLRDRGAGVAVVDNAKVTGGAVVSSAVLESITTSPEISLRILGRSANFTRPNDVVWFLTMNDTRISRDFASRGLPIRLYHEGAIGADSYPAEHPLKIAKQFRNEILGELLGMVEHWKRQGCPSGHRDRRFPEWGRLIRGILESCGFTAPLRDGDDANLSFSAEADQLAVLAEHVVRNAGPQTPVLTDAQRGDVSVSQPAAGWISIFERAGILGEQLRNGSNHSRAIRIGNFFGPLIDREVPILVQGRAGRATLRVHQGRARSKCFWFEIAFNRDDEHEPRTSAAGAIVEPTSQVRSEGGVEGPAANPVVQLASGI